MKIFISYSRKDYKYRDGIFNVLSELEIDKKIMLWVDYKEINGGDLFDDKIEKEIETSDVFLLLLSQNFWNSEYIQSYELPDILTSFRKKNTKVVPIILNDTNDYIEKVQLKSFSAIPQIEDGLKPIDLFDSIDNGYSLILKEIEKIVSSQDIGNNLDLLYLCRESLDILNPYDDFTELEIKKRDYNSKDKSFSMEFKKHYKNGNEKTINILIDHKENEEKLFKEYFLDIYFKPKASLVKLKDKLISQNIINKAEILNILNITYDRLFPRISKIEYVKEYIKTQDISNLQNAIQNSKSRKLLVYGDAGIGKTSTLSSFQYFSPDDIVVIYDSFGAGTYKDDGEKRHKEKYIRIQIINEIAIRLGLNPYVENELYDLEEEFLRYIKAASKLLPNNKIIIIIDAADNNVEGAKTFNEDIFIPQLWSLNLPNNCYLIMSSRGYRKYLLEQTSEVEELRLKGFDIKSSLKLILKTFSFVDKNLFKNFYEKTNGNPRLQSYLLNNIDNNYKKLQEILKGSDKLSLDKIFEDIWIQATAVIQPNTKKHLEELICLARPATIKNFILASSLSHEDSLKVIDILSPGITLKNEDQIGFLDEDFENFLLNKLDKQNRLDAYKRISNNLITKITEDNYSAKHIALFLINAKEYDLLIDIALNVDLKSIEDRLQRVEIERDRVNKALIVAFQEKKTNNLLKLLYKSALLLKSDESLNEILQDSNLELLALYTSRNNAIKVLTKNQTNLGAFNYHCAYLLAKDNPKKALEYLEQGDIWLEEYLRKDKEERQHSELNELDIAKKTATLYYIYGFKDAYISLKYFGWKLWFAFKIIDSLPMAFLRDLAEIITYEEYKVFLKKVHPHIQSIFLVKLNKSVEKSIDSQIVRAVSQELYKFILSKNKNKKLYSKRNDIYKISIDFIELASLHGIDKKILLSILDLSVTKDFRTLNDSPDLRYHEDTLYLLALHSRLKKENINLDEILENDITAQSDYDKKEEIAKKKSLINTLLPFYDFLIEIIVEKPSFNEIEKRWYSLLKKDLGYSYYHGRDTWVYSLRAKVLTKILVITKANNIAFESLLNYCDDIFTKKDISKILLEAGYSQNAFIIIEADIQRELKEASPSYEKLTFFLEYTNLIKDYDLERARYYFELALESAHGLDDNAFYLYKIIASYSDFISETLTGVQRVELANKHISLAESTSPYLDRTSNALNEVSFKTVSNLDISVALNLSLRWHDSIIYRIDDTIIELVDTLIKKELITPSEAFGFKYFVKDGTVIDLFINILDSLKSNTKNLIPLFEPMKDFIRKHLLSSEQFEDSKKLVKWLEENGFSSHKITLELQEFCKFYQDIKSQNKDKHDFLKEEPVDWDKFYSSKQDSILDMFKEAISIGYRDIDNTLYEFEKQVSSIDRLKCLEFIVTARKNKYPDSDYGKAFIYLIEKWKLDQHVRNSKDKFIKEFISNNYEMFIISYHCKNCIEEFSKYINKQELIYIILEKVVDDPYSIRYMEQFINIFELAKNIVQAKETYEVVQNFIKSFEERVDIQDIRLKNEENNITSVVRYLYKLMGHPDRRIRYKSMHTSRALIKQNILLIPIFLEQLNLEDGFPFIEDYSYYPISSKESLLTVFHKLSYEIIEHLKDHIKVFFQIVLDDNFPHVIIKHIAKQIVLNIFKKYPNTINKEEQECLKLANESKSSYIDDEKRYRSPHNDTRKIKRFDFDSMDTIPYWYDNICDVFKVDMELVLEKAEEWIVDRWGINTKKDLERIQVWDRDEGYHLKEHRHGNIPTVEEPIRHIEYNAMFLVAGELLHNYSSYYEHYGDRNNNWYECQYHDFLNRYFDESKEIYYELRDAKPLVPRLWGKFDKENISDEIYFELLEVTDESMILKANYSIYTDAHSEYIDIYSALVSSDNAKSLQNALQNTRVHDFHLPFDSDDNGEIDEDEFRLISWFEENKYERRSNSHDPYSHSQENYRYLPSKEFTSHCTKSDIRIENWADKDQGNRVYEPSSSGYKVHISKNSISKYLQKKNMDMLIQVKLRISDKKDVDKRSRDFQMYLFRQDGNIEKYEENNYTKSGRDLVKEVFSDEYEIDTYGRWLLFELARVIIDLNENYKEDLERRYLELIERYKNRKLRDY